MNDLLEQLVGELADEDEAATDGAEIEKVDDNTWVIKGATPLDKIAEELEIELPLEDYETFSGLIFDSFGSVPDDGEVFEIEIYSLHIKVEEIKNHMIKKTVVCKTLAE
jgi:putative hemolysin